MYIEEEDAETQHAELKKAKIQLKIAITIENDKQAQIMYDAVLPEVKSFTSDRSTVILNTQGQELVVQIEAADLSAARASINGILRWISMSRNLIAQVKS